MKILAIILLGLILFIISYINRGGGMMRIKKAGLWIWLANAAGSLLSGMFYFKSNMKYVCGILGTILMLIAYWGGSDYENPKGGK